MSSKRRIRWDRITVAAVVLVILIFLLGSCMQRCSDKDNDEGLTTAQQDSIPTEEQLETDDTASAKFHRQQWLNRQRAASFHSGRAYIFRHPAY